jgi:hypothetical protein
VPKIPNNSIWLWDYFPLNSNRGLIGYFNMKSGFKCYDDFPLSIAIAIISIDFDANVYEFIGESWKFPVSGPNGLKLYPFSSTSVGLSHLMPLPLLCRLYLFKIDASFSFISQQKSIILTDCYSKFHSIDGKIIGVKTDRKSHTDRRVVKGFAWINDDGLLIEIENTGACLKSNIITGGANFVCLNLIVLNSNFSQRAI